MEKRLEETREDSTAETPRRGETQEGLRWMRVVIGVFSGMTAEKSEGTAEAEFIHHVETSPDLAVIVKSSGLTPAEFWNIPKALVAADSVYRMGPQTRNPDSKLATPENVAFITQNDTEIRRIMSSWRVRD